MAGRLASLIVSGRASIARDRHRRAAGLGPLIGGMNLIHVVASYNGTLSISATADRDALPDPAHYADCMEHAFKELLAIAG